MIAIFLFDLQWDYGKVWRIECKYSGVKPNPTKPSLESLSIRVGYMNPLSSLSSASCSVVSNKSRSFWTTSPKANFDFPLPLMLPSTVTSSLLLTTTFPNHLNLFVKIISLNSSILQNIRESRYIKSSYVCMFYKRVSVIQENIRGATERHSHIETTYTRFYVCRKINEFIPKPWAFPVFNTIFFPLYHCH